MFLEVLVCVFCDIKKNRLVYYYVKDNKADICLIFGKGVRGGNYLFKVVEVKMIMLVLADWFYAKNQPPRLPFS